MLSAHGGSRILLYLGVTDMRQSFCGLNALVYRHRGRPEDRSYYVFVNRTRTRVKIMYWDGAGLALWYKRLEKGCFVMPEHDGQTVALDRRRLALLLEGVIPLRLKPRFQLPSPALNTL